MITRDFNVMDLCPFDLMRWGKAATYEYIYIYIYISQEYNHRYGTNIEILEAEMTFIEGGLNIKTLTLKEEY